ncbi:hypothetical protein JKY72_04195 [Candidatus Gracilibacteria bacterium]|nr:hypothetical protein [Candidatus Gracilibacteria bacterium]
MKKFFVSLALLSISAVALAGCTAPATDDVMEEGEVMEEEVVEPAADEATEEAAVEEEGA